VRSREQVRQFLKSMGMRCRRVGWYHQKQTLKDKKNFLKKLEPRLEEAKSGKRAVFLLMLLISSLGHIWDFYGALNAYLLNLGQDDNDLMSLVRLMLLPTSWLPLLIRYLY
jgi:hypothetical protein